MRLATYRANIEAESRLGVIVDDSIDDVALLGSKAGDLLPSQMLEFIDLGPDAIAGLRDLLDGTAPRWPVGTARPLANVTLLAPIPRPRKHIFGISLNYVEPVEESARTLHTATALPKQPVIFSKPPTPVTRPGPTDRTRQSDVE